MRVTRLQALWTAWICTLLVTASLIGAIHEIEELAPFEAHAVELTPHSLILFDVDHTLITLSDAILNPAAKHVLKKIIADLEFKNESGFAERKEVALSQLVLQAEWKLVDQRSPILLNKLHKRSIPYLAITAFDGGRCGEIPSGATWRFNHLKELGLNFSYTFPELQTGFFPQDPPGEGVPIYDSGIIYTSRHSKGVVLGNVLDWMNWKPNHVLMIDDRLDFLQAVESTLVERGIPFDGYHYRAVERNAPSVDLEVARLQMRTIYEKGVWLSDCEAREILDSQREEVKRESAL
ncbi:MAG: DUF2608 domain-containing protein [Chlamydiia bacterium]|nr:DUF2608 domain-containing protein [Chlamydiia bacterium]